MCFHSRIPSLLLSHFFLSHHIKAGSLSSQIAWMPTDPLPLLVLHWVLGKVQRWFSSDEHECREAIVLWAHCVPGKPSTINLDAPMAFGKE